MERQVKGVRHQVDKEEILFKKMELGFRHFAFRLTLAREGREMLARRSLELHQGRFAKIKTIDVTLAWSENR